jgi:hypothetical protein
LAGDDSDDAREKMQYSDRFACNSMEGRMGQDDVTLNTEPPRKDALDGFTLMMTGLRPRNLVRCADVTLIPGKLTPVEAVNSRIH